MSDTPKIQVGLVQRSCGEDPAENREQTLARARELAERGAQIICLQELYASRYFCQHEDPKLFDLAEPVPGPSTEAFSKLAKEKNVALIVPIFEKRGAGVYHNSAVVIDAGGEVLGLYRKMHIPHDPLFFEKYYFTPGDTGFRVFDTRFGRIGTLICWDQWFPEAARLCALQGAKILFYPTAIGWIAGEPESEKRGMLDAWQTIQRAHAIANGVFVAAPNRVGVEGELTFWGSSFIADPRGNFIARAGKDEELLLASCDLALVEKARRNWPYLRDRRIDAYGDLTKRLVDE